MKFRLPQWLAFAFRNVFRHQARSVATLAAISMGVAGLILAGGFVEDVYVQFGESIIRSQTGHLQITRQGYREGRIRSPEAYLIEQPDDLKEMVLKDPAVHLAMARLAFTGMLSNGKRDVGIIGEGVEPSLEATLGTFLHYIEGRALTDSDRDGIVLGQGVAQSLGLQVGDRATLVMSLPQGAVNALEFVVVGVFQSFSKDFDARAARIPLAAARNLMDNHSAHLVVLLLQRTEDTSAVVSSLRERLGGLGYEVSSWRDLSDFYEKTVQLYDRQFSVLRLIILLMVLLSVLNSVNMTLFERTIEFGTMLALGERPGRVVQLILTESAIVGMVGAILGIVVGCVAAAIISAIGIAMPPAPNANIGYTATIRPLPVDVLMSAMIGLAATCFAAIMPARRVSRMNIVDALRHGN